LSKGKKPLDWALAKRVHSKFPLGESNTMETVIALIALGIITILVMPNLLSKEVIIGLIAIGIFSVAFPNLLTREQAFAIVVFGILFTLIIPSLMK
jgi:hypothetical protein